MQTPVLSDLYVTPIVRKLASDNGVDLSHVRGTGIGGRIRKEDVLAAAAPRQNAPIAAVPSTSAPATTSTPVRSVSASLCEERK